MLWWNAQWRLDVDITNVTAAYCGINIAGRTAARPGQALQRRGSAPRPSLHGRAHGHVAGIPVRLLRVGFVGELGYEIHAPASWARRCGMR